MNDLELFIAHNIFINKGAYAILLGSGISKSAGIPTGWEVLIKLIERIAILNKEKTLDNAEKWYRDQYNMEPNYSKVIELLTHTKEERINLLKPFFETTDVEEAEGLKKPTIAHRYIANLVKKGYIKVIITTNFDRLIENSLREIGIEATIISNPNHIENVMPLIHSPITVIKINGDYLDTKFLNLESELNNYDDKIATLLNYIFENFGLLTAGWSAKWDIALREILQSSNKFRFSNFFTFVNKCEEELKTVSDIRQGKCLQIMNANSFFKELFENIEALEKGEKNNPLSKPIAIERLKKYILRTENQIDLYTLIDNEVQNFIKIINNKTLLRPENSIVKELIEFEIKNLDLLYSLIVEGIFWGNTYHHDIWIKIISKLAHPKKDTSGWALWSDLSYFPALIIFYAIGLTAFYRKNFLLLKKLFSIEIFNPYKEGDKINILERVNSYIIDIGILNEIYNNRQRVPMSEILYKVYKPEFEIRLSDDREFDELFDEFELFTSLKYIELTDKDGILPGRYIYTRDRSRNNIVYKKYEELNIQKDATDWIKEGLFKDYNSLNEYYDYFNETIKNLRY